MEDLARLAFNSIESPDWFLPISLSENSGEILRISSDRLRDLTLKISGG